MVILKNWSINRLGVDGLDKEQWKNRLCGNVYGHPNCEDGEPIFLGNIEDVLDGDGCKIVKTKKAEYTIYEADVSSDYASDHPDAYVKLSMIKGE